MRVSNFSAGPSALPLPVLQQAAAEMVCYGDSGMSVMEMSHRSKHFQEIINRCEARLRRLLGVPENYKVLFLQGGASTQFSMVPLNLLDPRGKADFVCTGSWSKKAIEEARKYADAAIIATSKESGYKEIPSINASHIRPGAGYVHITTNNTIYGTAYHQPPETGGVTLVADMSSDILSKPVEISRFGVIYAGAQKNAGCAGLTLVIIREDLIGQARPETPMMLDYATHAKQGSMYNTPPTYAIYIADLVYQWIEGQGGLEGMARRNQEKANLLYHYLDSTKNYRTHVYPPHRSLMNVVFTLADESLNELFIKEAEDAGLQSLKGHRSLGGLRASLYNAIELGTVATLVEFMKNFEASHC